jgi:hypothetical protein
MARMLIFLAMALLLAMCAATFATADATVETDGAQADPAVGEHEIDEDGLPIENPHYQRDVKTLTGLCKVIKSEMKAVFELKHHFQHEAGLMAHAADLGAHLDEKHREWNTDHHKEWSCKQVREILAHEKAQAFVDGFENWYNGKDLEPPVTHEKSVELVQRLHDDLDSIRLINDETRNELADIIKDLKQLEKWHLALRKAYDALMADPADQTCERHFEDFAAVLHDLHSEHVPEWHHVAEGTRLLLEQCEEDPTINAEL